MSKKREVLPMAMGCIAFSGFGLLLAHASFQQGKIPDALNHLLFALLIGAFAVMLVLKA